MEEIKLKFNKMTSRFRKPVNRNRYIIDLLRATQYNHINNFGGFTYFENIKAEHLKPGYLVIDPEYFLKLCSNDFKPKQEDIKQYAVPIYDLFPNKKLFEERACWNFANGLGGTIHSEEIPDDFDFDKWNQAVKRQIVYYNKLMEFCHSPDYPEKLFKPQNKEEYCALTNYDPYLGDLIRMDPLYMNPPYVDDLRGINAYDYVSTNRYTEYNKIKKQERYKNVVTPTFGIFHGQKLDLPDGTYPLIDVVRVTVESHCIHSFDFTEVYVHNGISYMQSHLIPFIKMKHRGKLPMYHIKNYLNRKEKKGIFT